MIVNEQGHGPGYLGKNRSDELAKTEREILNLESILSTAPERENFAIAKLEYLKAWAEELRTKEDLEALTKKTKENWIPKDPPKVQPGYVKYFQNDIKDVNAAIKMADHPMGRVLIKAFELCLKKNKDYATKEDIFSNFRESVDLGVACSAGVGTRLGDKWKRFKKGVRTGWNMAVESEGMEGTVLDIINYSCIYYCLYTEERLAKATKSPRRVRPDEASPGASDSPKPI